MNKIKIISYTLFLLFTSTLLGNTGDSTHPHKRQFGIIYSPEYAYRNLRSSSDDLSSIVSLRNDLEIPKFGYSTGFSFSYQPALNYAFEVQLLFSDKGEQTKKYEFRNAYDRLKEDRVPAYNSFVNHYYYLDVPLKLNYFIINKKVKLFLSAGISTNLFLYQKTNSTIENKNGSIEKVSNIYHPRFENINIAIITGFGMTYPMTDKCIFKIEPLYKRSITSVVNHPVKTYFYSIGVNFGLSFSF